MINYGVFANKGHGYCRCNINKKDLKGNIMNNNNYEEWLDDQWDDYEDEVDDAIEM